MAEKKIFIKPEELSGSEQTKENLEKIINDLFYKLRNVRTSVNISREAYDKLCDFEDGAPDHVLGIMMLMGHLRGDIYEYNREIKQYQKKKPLEPKEAYKKYSELVDAINYTVSHDLEFGPEDKEFE